MSASWHRRPSCQVALVSQPTKTVQAPVLRADVCVAYCLERSANNRCVISYDFRCARRGSQGLIQHATRFVLLEEMNEPW